MGRPRRLEGLGRATLRCAVAAYVLAMTGFAYSAGSSPTLTAVKARGSLVCGVNEGLPGFSNVDERGIWRGFDVDFCRAIAAAIFGDPKKVTLAPLSADARFQALRDGKIDVLARNSTWTMGREIEFGLTFVGATYYVRPGIYGPAGAPGEFCSPARRRQGVRAERHHHDRQSCRLLQQQRHDAPGGRLRDHRRVGQELRRRSLLCPDQRSFPALCVTSPSRQNQGTRSFCRT